MVLVRAALHDVAHAAVADDLCDDVVAQGPRSVGCVGQAAAAEVEFRVGHHLHESENLKGPIDEARPQEVVDALRLGGPRFGRVINRVGEFVAKLLVVEDGAVAVVGHADLVGGFHVVGGGEVAADPGRQPRASVGSHRKLRPVQGAQGLILPVQVGAPVRG